MPGFSIYYMGINLGSFLGSLLVPLFAAKIRLALGLRAARRGMLLGLVQFLKTRRYLGTCGVALAADAKRGSWLPIVVFLAAIAAVAALAVTGTINLNANAISAATSGLIGIPGVRVLHLPDLLCRPDP